MGRPIPYALAVLAATLAAAGQPAAGQPAAARADVAVDLELILAVDVSRSIDVEEARFQREGYIAALLNPAVIRAIHSGYLGRIAATYIEWAGFGHNKVIVDWSVIEGEASARAFAAKLAQVPLESASRTSISGAIDYAAPAFAANGFDGGRRVIDISGDGPNNLGRLVSSARDAAVAKGITINGLPMINGRPGPSGWPRMPNLDLYYIGCVIGGPGAFIVVAQGIGDFASAILRKMILEIAGIAPANRLAGALGAVGKRTRQVWPAKHITTPPCDAGERRWRRRFLDYDDF